MTRAEGIDPEHLPIELGRYTLESLLGEGGMARVFRALLHGPGGFTKPVALKVVKPRALDDEGRRGLIAEARIGALLNHPNVVQTIDLGEVDDTLFIAMELVPGMSAHALLKRHGRLPPQAALSLAIQACEGLAHAHQRVADGRPLQLVHRDLKPGNLMVGRDGAVKIADFGIALAHGIAEGHQVVGTPAYMSPEQTRGQPLGPASDLFAMGSVICALVLGHPPFRRHSAFASVRAIQATPESLAAEGTLDAIDAAIPGLGRVVGRCLMADPAARYPSAGALARDLQLLADRAGPGPTLVELLDGGPDEAVDRPAATTGSGTTIRVLDVTNVVADTDRFVGRDTEMHGLRDRLRRGRLVTVTGPGGAGKTRLIRELLAMLDPAPEGGVWWVDLAGVGGTGDLAAAVVRALGLGDGATDLSAALAARGPLVLALDPFDALVGLAADTVRRWLDAAPQLRIVVGSQERLRLPSEAVLRLEPLPTDDAVALFVARVAERSQPATQAHTDAARLTRGELGTDTSLQQRVQTLVERLEGVPLALELAAAQAGETPLPRLLRRGDPALQAVLSDSWERLDAPERTALAQLSVFADGFSMRDAEAVLDLSACEAAPWPVFVVEALIDKSLVQVVPLPELPGRTRFRMYSAVQRHAAARLDGDLRRSVEARFVARMVRRAAGMRQAGLDARRIERRWLRVGHDLGNLQRAQTLARVQGRLDDAAEIGRVVARVLVRHGSVVAGLAVIDGLAALPLDAAARAEVALDHARLLRSRGRLDEAARRLDAVPDPDGVDRALDLAVERARTAVAQGRPEVAVSLLAALLANPSGEASAHALGRGHLAMAAALRHRDLARARESLEAARRSLEPTDSAVRLAQLRELQGLLLLDGARWDDARGAIDEALGLRRRLGDVHALGRLHAHVGQVEAERGDLAEAMAAFDRARRTGGPGFVGAWRSGDVNLALGDLDEARATWDAAARIAKEHGRNLDLARLDGRLAELSLLEGDLERALDGCSRAVQRCGDDTPGSALAEALARRAVVHAELGDRGAAFSDLERALAAGGNAGPLVGLELALRRGQVMAALHEDDAALEELALARRVLAERGVRPTGRLGLLADDLAGAVGV